MVSVDVKACLDKLRGYSPVVLDVGFGKVEVTPEYQDRMRILSYGTATIPPRPWFEDYKIMRGDLVRAVLLDLVKKHMKKTKDGSLSGAHGRMSQINVYVPREELTKVGMWVKRDMQQFILSDNFYLGIDPNAPSTVKRKGKNFPLVDTGDMVKHGIQWRIYRHECRKFQPDT